LRGIKKSVFLSRYQKCKLTAGTKCLYKRYSQTDFLPEKMAESLKIFFSGIAVLGEFCYLGKFIFLKSTQNDGFFDTQHDIIR
jgi:hypothetical protein